MSDDNDKMSWGVHSAGSVPTPSVPTPSEVVPADYADLAARGPTPIRSPGAGCPHPRDLLLHETCPRCDQEIIAVLRDRDGRNLHVTEDDLPRLIEHAAYLVRWFSRLSAGLIRDVVAAELIRSVVAAEFEDELDGK